MRAAQWARLAAGLVLGSLPCRVSADDPPPEPVPTANSTARPADKSLEELVRALEERLATLETRHAEERAQDEARIAELESQVKDLQGRNLEATRATAMNDQIAELRREIARSQGQTPAASQPANTAEDELSQALSENQPAAPAGQPAGVMGSLQTALQSFNPDISVNGDFLGRYLHPDGRESEERLMMRELELGFSGALDPYTRADVVATVGREEHAYEIDLEEAYLTYTHLPFDLQARFGQMRAEFGRANAFHLHALPWIDYPRVIQRFFGEEGLKGAGGEVSWLVPNPWNAYVLLEYELLGNDNDSLFAGQEARDVTHLARLKYFRDLTPASTLEFGTSFATAPNDAGHGAHRSFVEGVDVTYRWKPKESGLYRSFLWQTEVLFSQAEIIGGTESSWGMYSAADYQFARRWKFGLRFDHTQLPAESSVAERGYSAYLTFLQSEFVFWRLYYTYLDRDFRDNGLSYGHEVGVQLNWSLGTHPAHKY